jgi:DNA-binding NarL/FixJ family response regulator
MASGSGALTMRVVLVDDQDAFRLGMRALLSTIPNVTVVAEAANGRDAVAVTARERPDIVLMDLRMPLVDGIAATRAIRARTPSARVLVLTTFDDDELVREAIAAGAAGYLLKASPVDDIGAVLALAMKGYAAFAPGIIGESTAPSFFHDVPPDALTGLTPRERDVLRELGTGSTNRRIAERLGLTEGTVRNYVTRILSQLGLTSRTQAALFARSQLDRM